VQRIANMKWGRYLYLNETQSQDGTHREPDERLGLGLKLV
jgi:hypothetical protein